ncbi:Cg30 [Apocheima cinerarium nucleopolyhedrovirus]|uniref:Cg30 n=1 Tax=Apocheima cinerarium nucleopolyhedrovirus TaxID=307461 RepID=UPI0001D9208E|nr:Cg30 [Apocheima cinerarium nucleopolyhedrovirus]ADB84416.1 Cg30 [Apocheima cinerarium nucleopolyhedrovirus]
MDSVTLSCFVCLSESKVQQDEILIYPLAKLTPCTHSLCTLCIFEIFKQNYDDDIKCPMCRNLTTGFRIYSINGNRVNTVDAKFVDIKDIRKIKQNINVLEFTKHLFENNVVADDNENEKDVSFKIKNANAKIIKYQEKIIEENVLQLSRIETQIKNAEEQNENQLQLNLQLKQEHNNLFSKNNLLRFEKKNLKEKITKLEMERRTMHEETNKTIDSFNTIMDTVTSLKRKIAKYKNNFEDLKRKKIKSETIIIYDDENN